MQPGTICTPSGAFRPFWAKSRHHGTHRYSPITSISLHIRRLVAGNSLLLAHATGYNMYAVGCVSSVLSKISASRYPPIFPHNELIAPLGGWSQATACCSPMQPGTICTPSGEFRPFWAKPCKLHVMFFCCNRKKQTDTFIANLFSKNLIGF